MGAIPSQRSRVINRKQKLRRHITVLSLLLTVCLFIQITPSANSATPLPTTSWNLLAPGKDNYPPSRFQSGRPSLVTGLRVISSDISKKTVTFQWNKNPPANHVDLYAIYYRAEIPAPFTDYRGVLVAVVSKNSTITSILRLDSNVNPYPIYPYGQNEIPVCHPQNCPGTLDQANVWVIAHNNFGWGDNFWFAANPDENPANFSSLSNNQTAALKPPRILNLNLLLINPHFVNSKWPTPDNYADYSNLERQVGHMTSQKELVGSKWTAPWVPDIHLPASRFGPRRPSNVKGLQVATFNLKTKQISFLWKPNAALEKVDSYAIYLRNPICPDDQCTQWLVGVVKINNFGQRLDFGTMPVGDIYGKVSDGKTLTMEPLRQGYYFWVIAHNKNGWGDNDLSTPNPDQENGDFRLPSHSESNLPSALDNGNGVTVSIPCSVLPISQQSSC